MFDLPLAFASPWVLSALIGLPILYYFLRMMPPRPRIYIFPPLMLLRDIITPQQSAQTTPWWILILRMLIAAALIIAVSEPVLFPLQPVSGAHQGPLVVMMDDGWTSAASWQSRRAFALAHIDRAEEEGRSVALVPLSDAGHEIIMSDAAHGRERLNGLSPRSFLPDHALFKSHLRAITALYPHAHIVWLSDGVGGYGAEEFAAALDDAVSHADVSAEIVRDECVPPLIEGVSNPVEGFDVAVKSFCALSPAPSFVRALDIKGRVMARVPFTALAHQMTHVRVALPLELRNDVARIELENVASAGAVWLLDDHSHRARVGLVSDEAYDSAQPLLSASYYITKAMQPFADVRYERDDISHALDNLVRDHPALIVLADIGALNTQSYGLMDDYVRKGGVLLRFAGPHMLASADDLEPVRVRRGGRVMGGALSWEQPKHIAPIDSTSPLFGMRVPDDVLVRQQLLAEPDVGLRSATWVALEDGTPLVTAKKIGQGMIVLIHVTADTTWSNLPLSGFFLDLLHRISDEAVRVSGPSQDQPPLVKPEVHQSPLLLAPFRILDGFGVLGAPPASAHALSFDFNGPVSVEHPAGYYGTREGMKALNVLMPATTIEELDLTPFHLTRASLHAPAPIDGRGFLLSLAFILLLCDGIARICLSSAWRPRWAMLALMIVALMSFGVHEGRAQMRDKPMPTEFYEAALSTHLAYVVTGDGKVDSTSRAGLMSLSRALAARTSLQPADPIGVDISRDELSFFPLLYWPIVANRPQPPAQTLDRVARFMRQGGTLIFDTRDALSQRAGYVTPEGQWLQTMLTGMDIPPLQIVPANHVVTKTFYLLTHFVGRTSVGESWIEALPAPSDKMDITPVRAGDNVSPLIITSNDLAAAWATDAYGAPLYPLIPNDERQREMALRGGINLVMYVLTGNYKADQVHVHDLLERLGH